MVRLIHNHMVVDNLSTLFAALAVPARRRIVDRLSRGPATVNEIARPFSVSQQAISKHLAYLERARLIQKRRKGREHFCALNPDAIRDIALWSLNYRKLWEQRYERLDDLLQELQSGQKRPRSAPSSAKPRKPEMK